MPLMLLGLVFVVGLFIFYLFTTRDSGADTQPKEKDDLKKEENVIFLPDDIESIKKKRRHRR